MAQSALHPLFLPSEITCQDYLVSSASVLSIYQGKSGLIRRFRLNATKSTVPVLVLIIGITYVVEFF